eukprot:SAG31_NODE_15885_length_733_cov_1.559937_1_plen_52_part_10
MPFDGLIACIDWSLRRGQNLQQDLVISGQQTQSSPFHLFEPCLLILTHTILI